ncbi:ABC transporter substrate-binding protein [Bradyrhizobium sp. 4]|uniref:ABC transporter substrate-binding protein n=1 Tax=unclassified Bradyrhizobium TaxID=2631580 RepID=UPI001FFB1E57|nr:MULTISPECIES: ABC transporter substrate-binding protein [unclassified Bradyrhizobium]MCK1397035.1 ABC transporter substrate-binding protein [Bradyrhizobium sp. 39]MCK1520096.1 ABC transporter substrate-binding protein [Bradyrhizobium sp. 17]MCK1634668.1 ABC transporter substrate-binding protein [Bradyrhizobium sp. 162]MCK1749242.1 ABC transporter substrate-binding protein [Bradyrhizobium sp. 135]UPJ36344.1 ABC transporter substrate-binding protein [Bradyrhizobium sp. 4]
MNRRDVLSGAVKLGAFAANVAPFVVPCQAQAGTTISFASWGGSYGDFIKEFWIKPFTAETGISVDYVNGPDLAKVKAQVTSNSVLWDVFDTSGAVAYAGAKEGFWELIDTKIVDSTRFARSSPAFAVPTAIYAGGIAYDPSRTKRPADDFGQLWDVKNFPGRRSLRGENGTSETLQLALLADGVAPTELYPLDVDRAFKALDRIKPHVKKWYSATAEGVSLIQTNEVDYTFTFANRVRSAKEAGVSIDFSFGQCISSVQYCTILRGSPRKEAAMRFLEFITRPAQQVLIANKLGVLPVTKGAEQSMDERARRWVPDLNSPKNVFTNEEYWADHHVELDKRFKEWILM